jgi:adenosine deaminase
VPPQDLKDHIAQAVAAGAKRIGHGTGIAFEDKAEDTMARMAKEGIAVEINLTSNAVILGVKGADHPLQLYRAHGVPVVLSTDDQGVLRSDMTNEYVRAVREQGLTYGELKQIARAGLHYSFVPGGALWADPVRLVPVAVCADFATPACGKYLAGNEKARLQLDLEQRFAVFEAERLARAGKVT